MESAAPVRYRKSHIRSSILDYLQSTRIHPSAEEVHVAVVESHPQVSFGTVYRNLNILVDQGEAMRLESSRGKDHFDAQHPFHTHFRCEKCERIYDLPFFPEDLTRKLSEESGHDIQGHQIEFYGTCADCLQDS